MGTVAASTVAFASTFDAKRRSSTALPMLTTCWRRQLNASAMAFVVGVTTCMRDVRLMAVLWLSFDGGNGQLLAVRQQEPLMDGLDSMIAAHSWLAERRRRDRWWALHSLGCNEGWTRRWQEGASAVAAAAQAVQDGRAGEGSGVDGLDPMIMAWPVTAAKTDSGIEVMLLMTGEEDLPRVASVINNVLVVFFMLNGLDGPSGLSPVVGIDEDDDGVILFFVDGNGHGGGGWRVLAATGGICWRRQAAWRAAAACSPAAVVAGCHPTREGDGAPKVLHVRARGCMVDVHM
ncbi:hypothetical protein ACLOJK_041432 [Asimina triloba]